MEKQYQEKKRNETLSNIRHHMNMKYKWEQIALKANTEDEKTKAKDRISFHNKMLKVWKNNLKKIEKEMSKLDV